MFTTIRKAVLLVLVCLLATSVSVAQNNRSAVSTTGSDLATCTVPDPCRTFDVAITKTNDEGEVIVLSSGGYGAFTVTKSISVIAPLAVHAAMAPASGTAITVNAPGATVILKGLYLNSLGGASTGVSISSAEIVHIENLVVNRFVNGIEIVGAAAVFVKDSEIRDCLSSGISASPASGEVTLTVDRTRLERNGDGLVADSGVRATMRDTMAANLFMNFWLRNGGTLAALRATIENTVAADAANSGYRVQDGARVTIRNSAAVRNGEGFWVFADAAGTTSELYLDQCLATENIQGVLAGSAGGGNGVVSVANSTAVRNTQSGLYAFTNGTVRAFGNTVTNNAVGLNGSLGTFESAGHNMVRGNGTETSGTIIPITTM
jgi:hypothetical protein